MSKKIVGFGIVGCGVISRVHAMAIINHRQARLVAVCDNIEERAINLKQEYLADDYTTDYHDLVHNPAVDIVCVCTPSGLHGAVAIAAAQAGKHVLVEKPMEIDPGKIDTIIQTCKESRVKLGCIFQLRTTKVIQSVKKILDSGQLGKIVMADAYMKYYRDQAYYDSADWRGTWEYDGGGALMNQCIHGIDLLQWLMGGVIEVSAKTGTLIRQIAVEDCAVAAVSFTNGALGVIQGSTAVFPPQELRIEIHGEQGTIVFSDTAIKRISIIGDPNMMQNMSCDDQSDVKSDPSAISYSGHLAQIDDMIQAILHDRDPMISGEEGRKAVDLILAIYRSAREKSTVSV
jgi:predicted dehydrogenase